METLVFRCHPRGRVMKVEVAVFYSRREAVTAGWELRVERKHYWDLLLNHWDKDVFPYQMALDFAVVMRSPAPRDNTVKLQLDCW